MIGSGQVTPLLIPSFGGGTVTITSRTVVTPNNIQCLFGSVNTTGSAILTNAATNNYTITCPVPAQNPGIIQLKVIDGGWQNGFNLTYFGVSHHSTNV